MRKGVSAIGGKTMIQSSANDIDVNRYSVRDRVKILRDVQYRGYTRNRNFAVLYVSRMHGLSRIDPQNRHYFLLRLQPVNSRRIHAPRCTLKHTSLNLLVRYANVADL